MSNFKQYTCSFNIQETKLDGKRNIMMKPVFRFEAIYTDNGEVTFKNKAT